MINNLLILVLLLIAGCSFKQNSDLQYFDDITYLTCESTNQDISLNASVKNILVDNFVSYDSIFIQAGSKRIIPLDVSTPSDLYINFNSHEYKLFVIPNDTLHLVLSNDSLKIVGDSDLTSINRYIINEEIIFEQRINNEISNIFVTANSFTSFKNMLDSLTTSKIEILNNFNRIYSLPKWYVAHKRCQYNYENYHFINTFGFSCGSDRARPDLTFKPEFYDYLDTLDYSDNNSIYSDIYYYFLFTIFNSRIRDRTFLPAAGDDEVMLEFLERNFHLSDSLLSNSNNIIYKMRIISSLYKKNKNHVIDNYLNVKNDVFFSSQYFDYVKDYYN